MKKLMHTNRPMWAGENADVVETAVMPIEVGGAEYRWTEGADSPEGAEAVGLKVGGPEAIEEVGEKGINNKTEGAE